MRNPWNFLRNVLYANLSFKEQKHFVKPGTYKKTQIKQSVGDKMLKFEAIPLSHSLRQILASALHGFLNQGLVPSTRSSTRN